MKFIEKYLEEIVKVKPLGQITTKEDELYGLSGEMVYIDGKCSDIFISHADYANWLEKQAEQKIDDNPKPKFKVGDWIIIDCNNVAYIESISETKYNLQCIDGYHEKMSIEYVDRCWHLWSIEDAKDGDVLVHNGCAFIFMGIKNGIVQALEENFFDGANPVSFGEPNKDNDYYPATKEQRDLFFQKMKEAGYTFDFEKKELKKIEQKSTWSREDEYLLYETIKHLEELIRIDKAKHCSCDVQYYQRDIDFIKSLKERVKARVE